MDLKLGQRVWDDFAEQDKIEREKKKYPSQEVLGFRIIGMRVSLDTPDSMDLSLCLSSCAGLSSLH